MSAVDPLKLHQYQLLTEKVKSKGFQSLSPEEVALVQEVESQLGDQLDEELQRYGNERMIGFGLAILGIILINYPFISVALMLMGAYLVTGFKSGPNLPENTETETPEPTEDP